MARRDNHYEAAFEAFLRWRQIPYVAVNETRRSLAAEHSLKSLDFLVTPSGSERSWLTDIKGRKFPTGTQKQYWKNWSTPDELQSLARWEELLGPSTTGLLVFAFHVLGSLSPLPEEELFAFRGERYGFVGVRLHHYAAHAHRISAKWDTVALKAAQFRALAEPVTRILGVPAVLDAPPRLHFA